MDRRYTLGLVVALVAIGVGGIAATTLWSPQPTPPGSDQPYPAGAGPSHIDFSALETDETNVSHTPRQYWNSYAISYTAPPERRLVEGEYYIDATTGEILADRWENATVYRNGTTYAFRQPADSLSAEQQRDEFKTDPAFVYDNATDAYYRYDPHYGQIAPTNIGRHPGVLEGYTWEATDRTTHHGVSVITYRTTGTRRDVPDHPPAVDGTLQLGVEDGIVYAFDITLEGDDRGYRYTYDVHPAPFPDHGWVDTARELAAGNTSSNRSSDRR